MVMVPPEDVDPGLLGVGSDDASHQLQSYLERIVLTTVGNVRGTEHHIRKRT